MARVALVTGGSRGIGAAISKALKAAGHTVAANYAGNDEAANKFKAETGIPVYKWSVADYEACATGIKQVEADLGPVDILVNNAGITRDMLALRLKDADWQAVLDTNLSAAFRLSRAALRGMVKRRYGRIVNVTSIVGVTGNPGQANYAAAKAGLIGMSKALAQEVAGRGITVNCIAPGFIDTAMTQVLDERQREALLGRIPAGRLGGGDDIAAGVVYLASVEAGYVTGQTLHVNGGMAMI
ncbi:MAG: 3-oxoacyl-[acyl-carrier-protein] reductase [Microvirga sp.]